MEVAAAEVLAVPKSKVILVFPYIAIAAEKYSRFTQLFPQYRVRPFYQHQGRELIDADIGITTFERGCALIAAAIQGKYAEKIRLIAIDEVHMIADPSRGITVESLILKATLIEPSVRIILLSATLGPTDVGKLSSWIRGFSFVSTGRPAPLRQHLIKSDGHETSLLELTDSTTSPVTMRLLKKFPRGAHPIQVIVKEEYERPGGKILLFANTRAQASQCAGELSAVLATSNQAATAETIRGREGLLEKLKGVIGMNAEIVQRCVKHGIFYHSTDLDARRRRAVEKAATGNVIRIIVATSTLAAGVDIPGITAVIVMSDRVWSKDSWIPLSVVQYAQMIGRAGRREGTEGRSYFCESDAAQFAQFDTICSLNIPEITFRLQTDSEQPRIFLECLAMGLLPSDSPYTSFLASIVRGPAGCQSDLSILTANNLVTWPEEIITPLGRAVAAAGTTLETAISLSRDLMTAAREMWMITDVTLIMLCIDAKYADSHRQLIAGFHTAAWQRVEREEVFNSTFRGSRDFLISDTPPELEDLPFLWRIYLALIIQDVVNGVDHSVIAAKWNVPMAAFAEIHQYCMQRCGQMDRICRSLGYVYVIGMLDIFRKRLSFCVQAEGAELLNLPACTRAAAASLVAAGITTCADVVEATESKLKDALGTDKRRKNEKKLLALCKTLRQQATEFVASVAVLTAMEEESIARK
jgi:replicative superfamily II helicase